MSRSPASPAAADSIVYVSLTPGTVPGGTDATIRRVGSSEALTNGVRDGGFDPVAIGAQVGDTILIHVTGAGGGTLFESRTIVTSRSRPVVVRTDPPPRKRDVPLNTAIVVVFSEPVAGASLSPASVQLRAGQSAVSGTVRFVDSTLDATHVTAEFVPDAPLGANTDYNLIVTRQIRDLDGDALAGADTASFTTGTGSTGAPAFIAVWPADSIMLAGTTRQLHAMVQDAAGNVLTDQPVTWSSSQPAVFSVSTTGLLTALGLGYAQIVATLNASVQGGFQAHSIAGPATSVTIVPATASMPARDTVFLTATANDARGFPNFVLWSSDDSSIAAVWGNRPTNSQAIVVGVNQGSATITAGAYGAVGTASIIVTPPVPVASVTVSPAVDTLVVLDQATIRLTATVRDSTNRVIGRPVIWSSDNAAVAAADANGLVTAVSAGTAAITATSVGVSGHADITVLPRPRVAAVTVVPETVTVILQDFPIVTLSATPYDSAGRTLARPITWSSANTAAATVDAAGFVTAVSPGSAIITATSESVSDSAIVTVLPPLQLASVTIAPASAQVVAQDTVHLAAFLAAADGRGIRRPVTWASDNAAVASVDANGLVTALTAGLASVTATSEGLSDTAAITVVVLDFASVSAGQYSTCGLTTNGSAYCWGLNVRGELGDGTARTNATVPVAVSGGLTFTALTVGENHACGLTATGEAYCWGQNDVGQLGNGGSSYLSRTPVSVAGGLTFARLSAGPGYTCGVTTAGAAYCWGDNTFGQLGNSGGMSPVPVPVAGGLTFTTVSAGANHACGLDATGVAYCWGDNQSHQIGNGSTNPGPFPPTMVTGGHTLTAIDAGGDHSCAISNGDVYCWGNNGFGELGNGTTGFSSVPALVLGGRTYEAISSGALTSCGIASGGAAYCWGDNRAGELGVGTTTGPQQCGGLPCSTTPFAVVGGLTFAQLSIEVLHTCGRTSTGVVYCWGGNAWGGLGDGTTTDRSAPVKVLGQP